MELTNDFRVSIPPADAWKVLTDLERIAPMLPGAQLQEIEGDEYRGIVRVKVGPITAQYKGTATMQEQDEAAGRVVLKAAGRDTRGQGNASALITATLRPDGDATVVTVTTDLTVTGKVAQFGRGVLADVSAKLMGQFADTLEADLRTNGAAAPPAPAAAGGTVPQAGGPGSEAEPGAASEPGESGAERGTSGLGEAAEERGTAEAGKVESEQVPSSGPRRVDHPEPEPVDLVDAAGSSLARRLLPVIGVAVVLLAWVRRRRHRRRAS